MKIKIKIAVRRRQLNFFVVQAVRRIISVWLVGKIIIIIIIIILSFRVGTSKNKKYRSTKLQIEATISLYSVIQCCQMY